MNYADVGARGNCVSFNSCRIVEPIPDGYRPIIVTTSHFRKRCHGMLFRQILGMCDWDNRIGSSSM